MLSRAPGGLGRRVICVCVPPPGDPGENDVSFATFPIGGNIYSEAGSANLIILRAALALDSSVDLFTVNRDFFRRIYS